MWSSRHFSYAFSYENCLGLSSPEFIIWKGSSSRTSSFHYPAPFVVIFRRSVVSEFWGLGFPSLWHHYYCLAYFTSRLPSSAQHQTNPTFLTGSSHHEGKPLPENYFVLSSLVQLGQAIGMNDIGHKLAASIWKIINNLLFLRYSWYPSFNAKESFNPFNSYSFCFTIRNHRMTIAEPIVILLRWNWNENGLEVSAFENLKST